MKRIFWVLMIVAVAVSATAWYIHRAKVRSMESGEVYVRDQTGGRSRLPTPAAASDTQTGQPSAANPTEAGNLAGAPAQQAPPTPPASDSIRRSPPSGMVFAGAGKYQLYRQGDITWRLNTDTGDACILFATETQWRRTLVYNHGCGAS